MRAAFAVMMLFLVGPLVCLDMFGIIVLMPLGASFEEAATAPLYFAYYIAHFVR